MLQVVEALGRNSSRPRAKTPCLGLDEISTRNEHGDRYATRRGSAWLGLVLGGCLRDVGMVVCQWGAYIELHINWRTPMAKEKSIRFQVKVQLTDAGEAPALQAYAYTHEGMLLAAAPLEQGQAVLDLPLELDGRTVEVVLGPRIDKGQPMPVVQALKRAGAYALSTRVLADKPLLELSIPGRYFPRWCFCFVRGRLVKRITLPNGTVVERPVCHARVHISEVDRIPFIINKLPDIDLYRLRDDLLDRLKIVPLPFPPRPEPGPLGGFGPGGRPVRSMQAMGMDDAESVALASLNVREQASVAALTTAHSTEHLRKSLAALSQLIVVYLCEWRYLWSYFHVDAVATVHADGQGRFSTVIFHDCNDTPDLYFWVEQFDEGAWRTVYRPSIGCGTYWNYVCGTEVVLNLPGARACEEPNYDVPPGVTRFVLPWAIASSPIWGHPNGSPAAPTGWVRTDGFIDYNAGPSLGMLYNAPFGGTLNFIHDDSYYIPSAGIQYYRYSWRRHSAVANTGASDASWTPIMTALARGYRMEYSDRLPTYQAYPVGPFTVGSQSGLFKFKPQVPPAQATDPTTVEVREWVSGNLSEVAASWNTLEAAPPLSDANVVDDAGDFDVKIEVFDAAGNLVLPGAATFRFLGRNFDGTTTRLASPFEEAGGAYVLRVHVDNNGVASALPQPSAGGVMASDNCGFLRYGPTDLVRVRYLATHPNQHAVFAFDITRGSNGLASASTLSPYVEVAAAVAPAGTGAYTRQPDSYYQRDFAPTELVGTCVNAAFAASLGVYGKATNGEERLGYDATRLIAFALAQRTGP